MSGRGEGECPPEARQGSLGVEAESAFPGQAEETKGGYFQLGGLFCLLGGFCELQGGGVVVGEHVGEVFHPFGCLRLDPPGGCDMPCGTGCPRELVVSDITGKDMPEGVLRLTRHRRLPGRTDKLLARKLPERCGDGL